MTSSNLNSLEALDRLLSESQTYQEHLEQSKLLGDWDRCLEVDINEWYHRESKFIEMRKQALKLLKSDSPELYFITVNPKPGTTLDMLMKHIHNFCSRKSVRDYLYSIEQRGETEETMGDGIHSHILLKWNKKDNKYIKQFLYESCKRIVGSNMPQILNVRRITNEVYQDKIDYLNGIKWDAEKDLKIKYDIKFREINKISPLYKKDGI